MPRGKQIDCAMQSPIYRQILKEVSKGYQFVPCDKTKKIIRIKKWKKYFTLVKHGVDHVKC